MSITSSIYVLACHIHTALSSSVVFLIGHHPSACFQNIRQGVCSQTKLVRFNVSTRWHSSCQSIRRETLLCDQMISFIRENKQKNSLVTYFWNLADIKGFQYRHILIFGFISGLIMELCFGAHSLSLVSASVICRTLVHCL